MRFDLMVPNTPYVVFESMDHHMYLSSDGAGNMSLKGWNLSHGPPQANKYVDPALLFREVTPN